MRRFLIALFVVVVCLLACTGNKHAKVENETPADSLQAGATDTTQTSAQDSLISDEPMPLAADELFDDFIFNFAANKKLQMERIVFPLAEDIYGRKDSLKSRQWKMEHFFMRQDYYTLLFNSAAEMEVVKDTSLLEATVEKIYLDDDYVKQYQFRRIRGRWKLCQLREQHLSQNVNGSFLSFYKHFVADSSFQVKSLASQIEFVGPDPDDDFSQMEGVILPEYWDVFAPELPSGLLYNIVYGKEKPEGDEKIFVLRGIANGLELEMTFSRKSGQWKLTKLIT